MDHVHELLVLSSLVLCSLVTFATLTKPLWSLHSVEIGQVLKVSELGGYCSPFSFRFFIKFLFASDLKQ